MISAPDPAAVERCRTRRARLLAAMRERGGGVAVHLTAAEQVRNAGSEFPYRFDSRFWYLTGFREPASALVLLADDTRSESWLFCRERDADAELWEGERWGPAAAQQAFGVDAAHPIGALDEMLEAALVGAPALFYAFDDASRLDTRLQRWLAGSRQRAGKSGRAPSVLLDLASLVDEMRLIKDAGEIATMRVAAQITSDAHRRAMRHCRAGLHEYEIEAEVLHEFHRHGMQASYVPIVAAGSNACVLHATAGATELRDGELLLIDAGCEVDGYAADVTRTFPVNGRFSAEQRALYQVVWHAQQAAIAQVAPGQPFDAAHDAASRVIAQGLIDVGLIEGSLDAALESKAYKTFFMHSTGHWLGLDVHDAGEYRTAAASAQGERPYRMLEEGMVVTVEPGLYVRPGSDADPRFHGIGIRIEDDVVVTASGNAVLSDAPKAPDDVEAWMRG